MKLSNSNKIRTLLSNTVMLYLLTFSTYLMSFIVVPYETRVLGPDMYGLLGVSTAIMVYFQLTIDFGFLLSATEEVSRNRDDKGILSSIFTSITVNKLFLTAASALVLLIICNFVPLWKEYTLFFFLQFVATALNSMMPDYLYRGIEKMGAITFRSIAIKFFFTVMIFVFVRTPEDYIVIPILNIIGNAVALAFVYLHLYSRVGVRFCTVKTADMLKRFKTSSTFFLSRIASTIYSAANTIILDLLSAGSMTAYYTAADKLVSTAKSGMSPIADSLYPYMIKNKDFKLVKKILLVLEPIIIVGCVVVFIWAEPLCTWFFGDEYAFTGTVLRTLLPVAAFILPTYIFGFPVLGAMGLSKHANYSVMVASAVHVVNLLILYVCDSLSVVTLGITTSIAEGIILLYRVIVVYKNRRILANNEVG